MTQDAAAQELAAALGRRMGELYEEQNTLADSTRVALRMHEAATEMCRVALEATRAEGQRQGRVEAYRDAGQRVRHVLTDNLGQDFKDYWTVEAAFVEAVSIAFIEEANRIAQAIQEAK